MIYTCISERIILRTVPICYSCFKDCHSTYKIYSLLMIKSHVDSRPAKNSCKLSSRNILLEICYFHLKTIPNILQITVFYSRNIYGNVNITDKYG